MRVAITVHRGGGGGAVAFAPGPAAETAESGSVPDSETGTTMLPALLFKIPTRVVSLGRKIGPDTVTVAMTRTRTRRRVTGVHLPLPLARRITVTRSALIPRTAPPGMPGLAYRSRAA